MLLERFIPAFEFREVHSIRVRALPSRVFQAIRAVEPGDIPGFRTLFLLRAIPARLTGQQVPFQRREPLYLQALNSGFVLLGEVTDQELVLGLIGQFWRLRGGITPQISGPQDFLAFSRSGFAKAAINFYVEQHGDLSEVRTETRVHAMDIDARTRFARYWALISTGSGYTRVKWLRAIRRCAERGGEA